MQLLKQSFKTTSVLTADALLVALGIKKGKLSGDYYQNIVNPTQAPTNTGAGNVYTSDPIKPSKDQRPYVQLWATNAPKPAALTYTGGNFSDMTWNKPTTANKTFTTNWAARTLTQHTRLFYVTIEFDSKDSGAGTPSRTFVLNGQSYFRFSINYYNAGGTIVGPIKYIEIPMPGKVGPTTSTVMMLMVMPEITQGTTTRLTYQYYFTASGNVQPIATESIGLSIWLYEQPLLQVDGAADNPAGAVVPGSYPYETLAEDPLKNYFLSKAFDTDVVYSDRPVVNEYTGQVRNLLPSLCETVSSLNNGKKQFMSDPVTWSFARENEILGDGAELQRIMVHLNPDITYTKGSVIYTDKEPAQTISYGDQTRNLFHASNGLYYEGTEIPTQQTSALLESGFCVGYDLTNPNTASDFEAYLDLGYEIVVQGVGKEGTANFFVDGVEQGFYRQLISGGVLNNIWPRQLNNPRSFGYYVGGMGYTQEAYVYGSVRPRILGSENWPDQDDYYTNWRNAVLTAGFVYDAADDSYTWRGQGGTKQFTISMLDSIFPRISQDVEIHDIQTLTVNQPIGSVVWDNNPLTNRPEGLLNTIVASEIITDAVGIIKQGTTSVASGISNAGQFAQKVYNNTPQSVKDTLIQMGVNEFAQLAGLPPIPITPKPGKLRIVEVTKKRQSATQIFQYGSEILQVANNGLRTTLVDWQSDNDGLSNWENWADILPLNNLAVTNVYDFISWLQIIEEKSFRLRHLGILRGDICRTDDAITGDTFLYFPCHDLCPLVDESDRAMVDPFYQMFGNNVFNSYLK